MSFPSSGFSCSNFHFRNTNQQGLDTIHPGPFQILQCISIALCMEAAPSSPLSAWALPSCLPLLLVPPSRPQSADEIISQKTIISPAANESQPSAATTAASPEDKQLLLAGLKVCITQETAPRVVPVHPSHPGAQQLTAWQPAATV